MPYTHTLCVLDTRTNKGRKPKKGERPIALPAGFLQSLFQAANQTLEADKIPENRARFWHERKFIKVLILVYFKIINHPRVSQLLSKQTPIPFNWNSLPRELFLLICRNKSLVNLSVLLRSWRRKRITYSYRNTSP